MDKKEITIIIPHYNGIEILDDCLQSLVKNSYTSYHTIVIDNGSSDGSREFVKAKYPWVELLVNSENLGYSGACNQGIDLAKTEYILLLNNDTVMPDNFLSEMVAAIKQDEKIASVQPKILSMPISESSVPLPMKIGSIMPQRSELISIAWKNL